MRVLTQNTIDNASLRFGDLSRRDRQLLRAAYRDKELIAVGVDMQRGFMEPVQTDAATGWRSNLYVPGAEEIYDNVEKMTGLIKRLLIPYIQTLDTHFRRDKEHKEFKAITDEHCIKGTRGFQLIPQAVMNATTRVISWLSNRKDVPSPDEIQRLAAAGTPIQLEKRNYSSFLNTPKAQELLSNTKAKVAILFGVAEDICNAAAVRGLLEAGFKIFVVNDAVKGISKKMADIPLFRHTQPVTTQELLDTFSEKQKQAS
jgi:nicotinamidase-related amidase